MFADVEFHPTGVPESSTGRDKLGFEQAQVFHLVWTPISFRSRASPRLTRLRIAASELCVSCAICESVVVEHHAFDDSGALLDTQLVKCRRQRRVGTRKAIDRFEVVVLDRNAPQSQLLARCVLQAGIAVAVDDLEPGDPAQPRSSAGHVACVIAVHGDQPAANVSAVRSAANSALPTRRRTNRSTVRL